MKPWYLDKIYLRSNGTKPFDWIVQDKCGASWFPERDEFEFFKSAGIDVIFNCSEFDYADEVPNGFDYHFINIPDFGIPKHAQVEKFLKLAKEYFYKGKKIVIHCIAGCGRTGVMATIWASYFGFIPEGEDPVQWIRKRRACSLESSLQVRFAREMGKKYKDKGLYE